MLPPGATSPIAARSPESSPPGRDDDVDHRQASRPAPRRSGRPLSGPQAFKDDLLCLADSLGELEGGALRRLIRAVETFGFHLATLDLRQNAEVHERVVGELLRCAGVEDDYAALPEAERVFTLRRELAGAPPARQSLRGLFG